MATLSIREPIHYMKLAVLGWYVVFVVLYYSSSHNGPPHVKLWPSTPNLEL